jgi:hypothetical protein
MKTEMMKAILYLWTRDAQFPVSEETEKYILDHLRKIRQNHPIFSDNQRALMAAHIEKSLEE